MVILINDVNSVHRGRDYFSDLVEKLKDAELHGSYRAFYFDYNIRMMLKDMARDMSLVRYCFDYPISLMEYISLGKIAQVHNY